MAESKGGAYGTGAVAGAERRTWDSDAYREKARDEDRKEKERMQANEELARKGCPFVLC